ncbi:DMT family transporter [Mannheimia haemolytica]|uniref:DMT family transporter n=1 Tax=Mannheimia haemolytica TaxID=75985 RepID=UPI0002C4EEBB|nr:DMT family transporter [Mannheimia haemolytica]MDW0686489.1 DMT family transporter [Mannheimia haemolytica]MDW0718801.1 DMT family transporter [Mannheimia haemolytica]MDW0806312.1 DMT family transporter [Mannheimia haemolytica]MDW1068740.1 DMT family transporter [Mannheimia haemolytica]MDW1084152.1 DMT family transporter [Mannheimia haemolytica]
MISGYIVWKNRQLFFGYAENRLLLLSRSITGLLGILCGVYIIDHLVLSDVDMIGKLTSFILIILSAIFLKERASLLQWILCLIAFIGALFIIKPAVDIRFMPYLVGVIGSVFAAIAYLCLRLLAKTKKVESPNTIVFFFSAFSTLILLPFVAIDYVVLTNLQTIYLVLAGVTSAVGQFCVTTAYKYAAAKDISIYSYASVLFSAILGLLFFEQYPDMLSWLGYAIIFVSSWLMFVLTKKQSK